MKITDDIKYIGVSDTKTDLFEGQYKVPDGIRYNSYLILDEKIVVTDTVDAKYTEEWLSNLSSELNGRKPDYLIIQHMEPDHSASLAKFSEQYPDAVIVANAKSAEMIGNYNRNGFSAEIKKVINGEQLSLGRHVLTFIFAPMVHWPEVMLTYDSTDGVLFSADAFGRFGIDINAEWADEARRYYIGIVGKYGAQVQAVLKKMQDININIICPLHGPVLKENISYYVGLYNTWSSYTPEVTGTTIAYTSVYGHTKEAAELLYKDLKAQGKNVAIYDLARTDWSLVVSEAFRYSNLVLATTTYNNAIFPYMKQYIDHLIERNFKNRTVALIENGSWAPTASKSMREMLCECKNLDVLEKTVTIKSSLSTENIDELAVLAQQLS